MYDTSQNAFGRRRRTIGATVDPLPPKQGNFLRKGEGNGGSPTNYILRQQVNERGQLILEPIAKRQGALSVVRKRNRSGKYQTTFDHKPSMASLLSKDQRSLSPK